MPRALVCLAVFAALAAPSAASAATIVVDTTEDTAVSTKCTLRAAIEASNTDAAKAGCTAGAGLDRIEFALPSASTITLTSELPEVEADVDVVGPGAGALTISGDHSFQVLLIKDVNSVSISGLTIADGQSTIGIAGGIFNEAVELELIGVTVRGNEAVETSPDALNPSAEAGGIANNGGLKLVDSSVVENVARAVGGSTSSNAVGGGIANQTGSSRLILERSTVRGNLAVATDATTDSVAIGGGIHNAGEMTLVQSTVSGNTATASGAASNTAAGGGINDVNDPTNVRVEIERSTIVGNTASAAAVVSSENGGGLTAFGSFEISASTIAGNAAADGANLFAATPVSIRNTIVARPLGGGISCLGTAPASLGFNLDEGNSCGFGEAGDQHDVDPLLAPALAANGGPTETLALLRGSPAIDRGLAAAGEAADQRGSKRPLDIPSVPNANGSDGTDVGAFEVQVPRATIVGGPADGATITDPVVSFEFVADEPDATFLCTFEDMAMFPCSSPYKPVRLRNGTYTFSVSAVGPAGYAQEPPTSRTFVVELREPRVEPPRDTLPPHVLKPVPAPRARVLGLPARTSKRRLAIRFSSDQAGSTFACRLDRRKWRACRSPFRTPRLALGKHTFRLKATGPTGVANPNPVVRSFRVIPPPGRG